MTKLIALVAAGAFAAGTLFAGEHGGNETNMACTASFASLNLTADQKTKVDAALTEHQKTGCTEASEAKFKKDVQGILTPQQFAKFKAECNKGKSEKTGA